MSTHYQILGVHDWSDPASIRAAYVKLMKRCHPDRRNASDAPGDDVYRINLAYSVLRDAGKRAQYDADLTVRRLRPGIVPGRDPRMASAGPKRFLRRRVVRELAIAMAVLGSIAFLSGDVALERIYSDPRDYRDVLAAVVAMAPAEAAALPVHDVPGLDPGIQHAVALASWSSLAEARDSSMRCFRQARVDRSLAAADSCIAFDLAYSYWHEGEFTGRPSEDYFQPTIVQGRHQRALAGAADDPVHRMDAIRAKTFSTWVEMLSGVTARRPVLDSERHAGPRTPR